MTEDRIIDKIKKCLELAKDDRANPSEAANALRQAQALMKKHNVTLGHIDRSAIGTVNVTACSVSRPKRWELDLMHLMGRAFGCKVTWISGRSGTRFGRFNLIGVKSQLEIAHYTAEVMQRKLYKARANYVSTLPLWMTRGEKTQAADGFCIGWVEAVQKTVHDFEQDGKVKLLLETIVKEATGDRQANIHDREVADEDMMAGYRVGKTESIHRPMKDRDPQLQIGHDS
jgi:hypothetical protein